MIPVFSAEAQYGADFRGTYGSPLTPPFYLFSEISEVPNILGNLRPPVWSFGFKHPS